jgi:Flp pilus assembly protein TadG
MDRGTRSPQSRLKGGPRLVSRRKRFFGSERGTAIVEFALIAPLLFLLLFGVIEFGRALNYYNDLTQLAGQAARSAIVNRNPDGSAVGIANNDCPANNMTIQCQIAQTYPTDGELKNGISVCLGTLPPGSGSGTIQTNTTPQVGDPVTVRTKYVYNFLTRFFGFGSITLTSTQTERLEAPATWQEGNVSGPGVPGQSAC